MKKIYTLILILPFMALLSYNANAQISIGAFGGMMNYYGDASDASSLSLSTSSVAGGVFVEKEIARFFKPQFQFMYGGLRGSKEYLDVSLNGNIIDLSLKLQLDLIELLRKDSKLEFSINAAPVLGFHNSEVTYTSTGSPVDASHVNSESGYAMAFGVGIGERLGYQLNSKLNVFAGLDMRYFFTDLVDNYDGLGTDGAQQTSNDWTSMIHAGVSYTINPKSKDIYEEAQPLIAEEKDPDKMVNGVFVFNNLPKAGVKMNIFDANETKIASTITDINGQFKFDNLNPDESYIVRLGEDDKGLFNNGRLYIINEEGQRVAAANKPGFNAYTFTQLTTETTNAMPALVEDIPTVNMNGLFVYKELPKGGVKIYLVDEDDNKIDSTVTRADGTFKFSKLNPNGNYLVKLNEEDASEFKGADLFFTNPDNQRVLRAGTSAKGGYTFKAIDETEMATLDVLRPEDGSLLYRKVTDEDPNANVEMEKPLLDLPKKEVLQATSGDGDTDFEKETIYFRHNSFWITQNQQGTKGSVISKRLKENPKMRITIEGWTSQSGDEEYNLMLSQKRADTLKRLLVSQYNIAEDRIEAVGKGEVEDATMPETEARRARIIVIN